MKAGIMQPYFFPYLGYFDLINRADVWVVFDVVKYQKRSWMNRNRILHPKQGWQYISVPVRQSAASVLIKDTLVVDKEKARKTILGQIDHYRVAGAPYFAETRALVDECFLGQETNFLRDLNIRSLAVTCGYLGIRFDPIICSERLPDIVSAEHSGAWALRISKALGATGYINPPGGQSLFIPEKFEAEGIELTFSKLIDFVYPSPGYQFVDHLSIIDVLMWNKPDKISTFLHKLKTGASAK